MLNNLRTTLLFTGILWVILIVSLFFPLNSLFGLVPRDPQGLIGIVGAPFLHGNIEHLLSNTVPLIVLMLLTLTFYKKVAVKTMVIIVLLGGLLVWGFGRNSIHIGASGLIYGLAAFLFFSGIFRRNLLSIIISIVIFFLYGGLIYGIFPIHSWMSWEGHLSGAVSGILCAFLYRKENESTMEFK